MVPDVEKTREDAAYADDQDDRSVYALLYVGDQVGELVTILGAGESDRSVERRRWPAIVAVGAIGLVCALGFIGADPGVITWPFAVGALVCVIVIGALAQGPQ